MDRTPPDAFTNTFRLLSLAVLPVAVLMGCEGADRFLGSVDRALKSRTVRTITDITQDPEEALRRRAEVYKRDPGALVRDMRAAKVDFQKLMAGLKGSVGETWGEKEVEIPRSKRYVKYTQSYKSRAIVDFDTGEVTVETLDEAKPEESLREAIVTTLLTPNDPRAVDLFSDKGVTLTGDQEPYLLNLVLDDRGRAVRTPEQAERFAAYLMREKAGSRRVDLAGTKKTARFVKLAMVPNFAHTQAEKYRAFVERFADSYKISPNLVFAIIRTESNFNPYAVSSAPAYGLMQLVPTSGGRDAYRRARGADAIPSRDYLFNPKNNIELGSAYLNVLTYSYLEKVANPVSREYCVISAYNTGTGNVLRTFEKDRTAAVNHINSLHPAAVYKKLRKDLPHSETRRYLYKVVTYRKEFVSPSAQGG